MATPNIRERLNGLQTNHEPAFKAPQGRWRSGLKKFVPFMLGIFLTRVLASAILPQSKTYAEYATEILSSTELEQVAQAATNQMRAETDPATDTDWPKVETFLATCMRSKLTRWRSSNDPRLNQEITKSDVAPWTSELLRPCGDTVRATLNS